MDLSLRHYIKAARAKRHSDEQIKRDLLSAGWNAKTVTAGLAGEDLPVPPPPVEVARAPRSVVQTFSTRGLEYIIMFISLGVAALSLGSLLHSNINTVFGSTDTSTIASSVSFSAAALIVSLPIFIVLFLRLKKLELSDPGLLQDPSRKRAVQITLVITFLIGLGNIIYFVYSLMTGGTETSSYNMMGSQASPGIIGNFIHLVISLAIAGGIFVYYWRDEHHEI